MTANTRFDKNLIRCLEKTIDTEFVSVYHNYDTMETVYTIPYNASLASRRVKLTLIRAMGLDWDNNFDENNPYDIDKTSWYLLSEGNPTFSIITSHHINKQGVITTDVLLDFEGEVLMERSYPSDKVPRKCFLLRLMRKCSEKVIAQERAAQAKRMEKMFMSMNMFNLHGQHGRM